MSGLEPLASHASQRPFAAYLAEVCESGDLRRGVPLPLGAQALENGVNFALFSRDAVRVRLELPWIECRWRRSGTAIPRRACARSDPDRRPQRGDISRRAGVSNHRRTVRVAATQHSAHAHLGI